ncbi:tyrosine-type recombinase/integrase [Edaphobacter bradus]|uniref:tyrosine-type recombinase/integrase n=1 Tax=Edaphobacter bradus TaxID=2259016 RepID=UPI0037BF8D3E
MGLSDRTAHASRRSQLIGAFVRNAFDLAERHWRTKNREIKSSRSVIPQVADRLAAHRKMCGNPFAGPIFVNSLGRPLDLDGLYQRVMREVLHKAGITWKGWHGFRRGLASNLNRLGVDDSIIQGILRHSTVVTTQNHYIKTVSADSIAAMRRPDPGETSPELHVLLSSYSDSCTLQLNC